MEAYGTIVDPETIFFRKFEEMITDSESDGDSDSLREQRDALKKFLEGEGSTLRIPFSSDSTSWLTGVNALVETLGRFDNPPRIESFSVSSGLSKIAKFEFPTVLDGVTLSLTRKGNWVLQRIKEK